jgi:5-methylcytosine-specific restriction endonuclease McrA
MYKKRKKAKKCKYTLKNKLYHLKDKGRQKDPRYGEWRRQVKQRDGRKCQFPGCPHKGGYLQIHHIMKWSDFPHLRYEVNNGITLCKKCHDLIKNRENDYVHIFHNIVRQNSRPLEDQTARILEMYNSGINVTKISKATGICGVAIYTILKKNGVKLRGRWEKKE